MGLVGTGWGAAGSQVESSVARTLTVKVDVSGRPF